MMYKIEERKNFQYLRNRVYVLQSCGDKKSEKSQHNLLCGVVVKVLVTACVLK